MTQVLTQKYSLFLLVTGAVAFSIYLTFKSYLGVAGTYFLLTAVGQAHFMMGYIWSVPEYRRWPRRLRLENVIIFAAVASALYFTFYHSGLFDRNTLWLVVIFSGIVHFMRDYKYFFNQLSSGFTNHARPFNWTLALAALFFVIFFGVILAFPEQQLIVLSDPDRAFLNFHRAAFIVAAVSLIASFASLLYSQKLRPPIPFSKNHFVLAFLPTLPLTPQLVLTYFTVTDFFLFIAFWHIIQWYGYMALKIHHRSSITAPHRVSQSIVDRIYYYWGKNAFWFIGLTLLSDAILLGSFIFFIRMGIWQNFEAAVTQSFLWGVGGYAFFSVLHFIFTALLTLYAKRARTQPTPFLA